MNPNKQKRKLTLVSFFNGTRAVSMFVYLPTCGDGKVRMKAEMLNLLNARRGDTVTVG